MLKIGLLQAYGASCSAAVLRRFVESGLAFCVIARCETPGFDCNALDFSTRLNEMALALLGRHSRYLRPVSGHQFGTHLGALRQPGVGGNRRLGSPCGSRRRY
jgi:hypothetical protein